MSTTPDLLPLLDRTAHLVAADGIDAHEGVVDRALRAARALGLSPVLCATLADRSAPRPARERAYGLLHRDLTTALDGLDHRRLAA